MIYVKSKAKVIWEWIPRKFLDDTLHCKKELEKEGSDLTDKTMFTSGIYFECAKEQIFFLNPNMDLSPIDFLNFVRVGELVDKEAMASLKLKNALRVIFILTSLIDIFLCNYV